ncbi:hypothetical protein OCH239_01145 [Roseivivax halodurans JCM 10272]|uniref:PEP-CTERM protein-sorting domain-containing protein n=1 Tax=Roseivivax halodurans JCM 10272 TaxID=1449350 RepID=X7EKT9_9RHOB|nr:VPLPA-CTERM sorting domain-containing protein [Roseivivax halodurans]ETX16714.1 hypothetical protein OCH239_01145 [Roseivivax halodurans JCM 10272]
MRFKARIVGGVLGLSAAFCGSLAGAATVNSCATGSGLACLVDKDQFGSGNSGNDKEESVELALAAALSLASIDLKLLGKSDAGYGPAVSGTSGSWTTPSAVAYFTVKSANSYVIYAANNALTGSWSTMGINNKKGEQRDVSHISYWSTSDVSPVPVPAAGFLLIGALGGLAALRRRKAA